MLWMNRCRRLHRRYERKAEHLLAFVGIAALFRGLVGAGLDDSELARGRSSPVGRLAVEGDPVVAFEVVSAIEEHRALRRFVGNADCPVVIGPAH